MSMQDAAAKAEENRAKHFPEAVLAPWRVRVADWQERREIHSEWVAGMRPMIERDALPEYTLRRTLRPDSIDVDADTRAIVEVVGSDPGRVLHAAVNFDYADV